MDYNETAKIIDNELKKYEVKQKPMTAEEIKSMFNNPMQRDKREELYNAFFCYDEQENICGYNIQVRLKEGDVYKLRFYLPLVDESWKGVKKPEDLPDKKVKVGFDGEFQSQNELLKKNDIKMGQAMFLNFKGQGVIYLGEGFVGISTPDTLYYVACGFKYAGYPINEATRKMNEQKLFV